MLNRLLALVARGGLHSQRELARELGASEPLIERAIQDLVRMGYLKPLTEGCQEACTHCPLRSECAIGGPARVWTLTEKGIRVAERMKPVLDVGAQH